MDDLKVGWYKLTDNRIGYRHGSSKDKNGGDFTEVIEILDPNNISKVDCYRKSILLEFLPDCTGFDWKPIEIHVSKIYEAIKILWPNCVKIAKMQHCSFCIFYKDCPYPIGIKIGAVIDWGI